MNRILQLALPLALFACVPAQAQETEGTASFINTSGESVGEARLAGSANGVLIELELSGLDASGSWVSFHIHENGACEPETDFESAGGHFNPDDSAHGYFAEGGPHAGDMPNQYVGEDGVLRAEVFNHMVRLDDIRGLSLMIHGGTDDYSSQPSGDAGDRIACAVIE